MPDDVKTKSAYEVKETTAVTNEVEYYPENYPEDSKSDIPLKTKIKISDYMHAHSTGKAEGSLNPSDKYPKDAMEITWYSQNETSISPSKPQPIKNSSFFTKENPNRENIKQYNSKLTVDEQKEIGADLPEGTPIAQTYVSSLLTNNKWTPSIQRGIDSSITIPKTIKETQNIMLGAETGVPISVNVPRVATSIEKITEYDSYSENKLLSVGAILSTRASMEKGSNEDGYDVNSNAADLWGILPGWAQLAVNKPDVERFSALDALKKSGASNPEFIKVNEKSWGAMNNVLDQYSGASAVGMSALAVALILGMLVGLDFLSTILNVMHNDSGKPESDQNQKNIFFKKAEENEQIKTLGRYKKSATQVSSGFPPLPIDLTAYLGMIPTSQPWDKCVRKGMMLFFGSDKEAGGLGSSLNAVGDSDMWNTAMQSPGFYIVFVRSVLRSGYIMLEKIKKIFGATNLVSGFKQILDFFEVMRTSKLMLALNLFARIGDAALGKAENQKTGRGYSGLQAESYIDSSDNDQFGPRTSIQKQRLKNVKGVLTTTLAWGVGQSGYTIDNVAVGTSLICPSTVRDAAQSLGESHTWLGVYSKNASALSPAKMRMIDTEGSNRIPSEYVEKLEQALDSTYVPFYFHDIRTNEILTFHAFLTGLTDQFSPEWNKMGGYGRTDPVYSYKSTERKISLGFIVAALNADDFQQMWIKINKLVTLVYPQYTEGTAISIDDGQTKFVQPFSQMFSASPLIRLRVGDLIRSNYSKYDLARLFGYGSNTNNFQINGEKSPKYAKLQFMIDKALKVLSTGDGDVENYTFTVDNISKLTSLERSGKKLSADEMNAAATMSSIKVKVKKKIELDDRIDVSVEVTEGKLKGATGQASLMSLSFCPSSLGKERSDDEEMPITEIEEFFSDDNAVVRSFKSTAGRGLAGVITDLSFDFYEQATWETNEDKDINNGIGSQAPKMCKISLSFSPIHDIAPGIDHMGFNRAPVYPVGHPFPQNKKKE